MAEQAAEEVRAEEVAVFEADSEFEFDAWGLEDVGLPSPPSGTTGWQEDSRGKGHAGRRVSILAPRLALIGGLNMEYRGIESSTRDAV